MLGVLRGKTGMTKMAAAALAVGAFACGGGGETPDPPTAPAPVTTATPTPAPTARPTADPESWKQDGYYQSLAEGPVVRTVCKVRSASDVVDRNVLYEPPAVQAADGAWIIPVNRYVVLDSDAFNGSDRKCKNDKLPVWEVENDERAGDLIGGSQPFLYKFITERRGEMTFWVTMDGIKSPALVIRVQ